MDFEYHDDLRRFAASVRVGKAEFSGSVLGFIAPCDQTR
jgi:hypothetical protein